MTTIRIDEAVYTNAETIADSDMATFHENVSSVYAKYVIGAENEAELNHLVKVATSNPELKLNPEVAESVRRARETLAVTRSARRNFLASVEAAVAEAAINLDDVLDVLRDAHSHIIVELEYAGVTVEERDI